MFIGKSSPEKCDTLLLSIKEKKCLVSTINKLKSYYWKDSLFVNSKRIPADRMWAHIKNQNQKVFRSKSKDTTEAGNIEFINELVDSASTFQFSPLIYFRNKSIFIVYILRLCGGECGDDELAIYRLENGIYKKWFILSSYTF
jgi:hypothetical protein